MDLYVSASESDTGCKDLLQENNISTKKSKTEKELLLAKKLQNISSYKSYAPTNDKEAGRFKKEIENLKKRIAELKLSLQKKDTLAEDYLKKHFSLTERYI